MNIFPMIKQDAHAILAWTYEAPYNFYNSPSSDEALEELMSYQVIYDREGLIGFFCLGPYAQVPNTIYTYNDSHLDIGLGMHPNRTGKGHGRFFVAKVIEEAEREGKPLRLTVACFNQRAIHLYKKFGFQSTATFEKNHVLFSVMER